MSTKYKPRLESSEEIEKIFKKESSEKKKIGYGVYNRARRGSTGTIYNHYDKMSSKQKKEYLEKIGIKGEVIMYNERDDINNIKTYEEVLAMPKEAGKTYIEDIRKRHTLVALRKYWNVTQHKVYKKMYPKFGIEVNPSYNENKKKKQSKILPTAKQVIQTKNVEIAKEKPVIVNPSGFNIQLRGVFSGEETVARLLGLSELIQDKTKYTISLELKENLE